MSTQKTGKFWSCGQEKMIFFRAMEIAGCCANLKTGRMPLVGSYGPGGVIDIDELANSKRADLAAVRQGETPKACVDCPSWTLMDVADDDPYLFNDVNIGHHTACNTDCYYCNTNSNSAPVPIAARKAPPLFSLLKEMVERGYIDPDAIIRFGGGEPTILPEFEKLVDYFIDVGRRFFIASSGVRYSPAIERMLRVAVPAARLSSAWIRRSSRNLRNRQGPRSQPPGLGERQALRAVRSRQGRGQVHRASRKCS